MKNPNKAKIRYDRDELLALLQETYPAEAEHSHASLLDAYEARRAAGKDRPCQSLVHHGPGHQSSTYCQTKGDLHDEQDGKVLHYAALPSGGYAEWTDEDPYARNY